jgi:hypothetical protein
MLTSGKAVTNFDTGRKFPASTAAARGGATAAAPKTTAGRTATTRGASAARAATPARATRTAATPARTPRAAAATAPVAAATSTAERTRGPGEHSLFCSGPSCTQMALPGSDYCMKHQSLA